MLNRFWNYQLLLSGSLGFINPKKTSKYHFFILFSFILFIGVFIGNVDGFGVIFYPIIIALCMVYSIINSENKLFELVPVSKVYSLINLYLYVFLTSLAITIGSTIALILATFLMQPTSTLNILVINWNAMFLISCISTIITSILLPVFFIRLSFLRKILTISVTALTTIVLLYTAPVASQLGNVSFLENIKAMPHYNETLLILICVCLVIIPISIFISYRLYKGKRFLIC
ncbi:MAG: ABC-2 transporter permease [Clostridium sp.]|uniref:ABC-2 transporter permease n=1 Tax=Clostridium sp. TaxID=1506 RepID=UPI003D6CFA29